MQKLITILLLLFLSAAIYGQKLYVKTFGNTKDLAIIFLHGGPGYNSVGFEVSTAQKLSDLGFFVIVYDRRGEGRSEDPKAKFTFEQSFDDLNSIYKKYKIKKAVLLGHSFGGIVASLYAEKFPKKVSVLVLLAAPISLQATFKNIIDRCKLIYQTTGDDINMSNIEILENMDTASIQYSSYCFIHAMQNNFYTPMNISEEAKNIYSGLKSDTLLIKYGSLLTKEPTMGFWRNEKYTSIDLNDTIKKLKSGGTTIYGIYGMDDGLFSVKQVEELSTIIGKENMQYYLDCSHNVYFDKQSDFLVQIKKWLK